MFRRLSGPQVIEAEPVNSIDDVGTITHKMVHDEKTILALVAAMLYTKEDITPGPVVDRASALIREVNAR